MLSIDGVRIRSGRLKRIVRRGSISHEGLRELLRAENVSFQAVKTWKASADPDYAAKKARVDYLYAVADGEAVAETRRPGRGLLPGRMDSGQVIRRAWLALHYPPYWHYDILQALLVLSRAGKADDPRASDALDELQRRRLPDGRWQPAAAGGNRPAAP